MTVVQDDRAALALQALAEVTDPAAVGELVEVAEGDPGVRELIFACRLPGYIGWRWSVSTARVADVEPTVLEVELLPGEGALVAPPWVPWAERLAEYRRTHPDDAEPEDDDELESDDDDELETDDDDLDDLDESDTDALEIDGVEFEDSGDEDSGDEDDGADDEEPGAEHSRDEDDDADDEDTDDGGRGDDAPGDEDAAWHGEGDPRS